MTIVPHSYFSCLRWRLEWDNRQTGTKEMLREASATDDRQECWWSFPFMWLGRDRRHAVQGVCRAPVPHLSPEGAFVCPPSKHLIDLSICTDSIFPHFTIGLLCENPIIKVDTIQKSMLWTWCLMYEPIDACLVISLPFVSSNFFKEILLHLTLVCQFCCELLPGLEAGFPGTRSNLWCHHISFLVSWQEWGREA